MMYAQNIKIPPADVHECEASHLNDLWQSAPYRYAKYEKGLQNAQRLPPFLDLAGTFLGATFTLQSVIT
jgi:hypothetical protein